MHDDGDTVIGQNGLLQAGRLLLVLQRTGGKTDVAGTLLHGGDAGAGAGGVVVDGHTAVGGHEGLAQCADDLLHRGGAVSGHGAGDGGGVAAVVVSGIVAAVVAVAVAAGHQAQSHDQRQRKGNELFHNVYLLFIWCRFVLDVSSLQLTAYGRCVK